MDPWLLLALGVAVVVLVRAAAIPSGVQAFAESIAVAEGYGLEADIGTARNNPGNITDGSGTIRSFDSESAGWSALYELLQRVTDGTSTFYRDSMTISQFAATYTATEAADWANNVVYALRQRGYVTVTTGTTVGAILRNQL